MNSSHDQLERDLRAALRSIDHVPVSGDAWQQNQRRLRESGSRRGHRVLAAAAVVLVVLLVGGLLAALNGRSDSGTPANNGRDDGTSDSMSSDEMFADENLLGPIVEARDRPGRRRDGRARGRAVRHLRQGTEPVRPGSGRLQQLRRLHES